MNIVNNGPKYDSKGNYIGDLYVVDGIEIYVCYPQNTKLTGNVETTFFWPGYNNVSGYKNGSMSYVKNYIKNSDNSLLIAVEFDRDIYSSDSETNRAIEAVNGLMKHISEEKNINLTYSGVDCCSAGGVPSTKQFLSLLENNNQSGNKEYAMSLNLYDPYSYNQEYLQYDFTEEDINALKENNTQVTFFTRNDPVKNYKRIEKLKRVDGQDKYVTDLVNAGIYPVIIYGNYDHTSILKRVNEDGWLDYQKGLIGLEDIKNTNGVNYRINIYENGEWVEYELSEIVDARLHPELYGDRSVSLINAGKYLDNAYININYEYLNEISSLSGICKSVISKASISSSSTSILLPEETEIINQIDDIIVKMQDLFASEINKIKDAGMEYLMLEERLSECTETLNDFLYNDPSINTSKLDEENK